MVKQCSTICFWLLWPVALFWVGGSRRVRIAVLSEGDVLCIQSYCRPHRWQLPGGGIKRGESVEQAAVRELREETGLELDETSISIGQEESIKESGISYHMYPCVAQLQSKSKLSKKPFETAELEWRPIQLVQSAAEQYMPSATRTVSWATTLVIKD